MKIGLVENTTNLENGQEPWSSFEGDLAFLTQLNKAILQRKCDRSTGVEIDKSVSEYFFNMRSFLSLSTEF